MIAERIAPVALLVALALGVAGATSPHAATAAAGAEDAAPLAGVALDGRDGPVAFDDYRGRVVYVDFFASWCAPCRDSFPFMDALLERHGDAGLEVVAIGLDEDPADALAFARRLDPGFDVAVDPAAGTARTLDVRGMPSSYLLGPDGEVLWSHVGFRRADAGAIEAAVVSALGASRLADADGTER